MISERVIGLLTSMDEWVVKDRLSGTPTVLFFFLASSAPPPFFVVFLAMSFLLPQTERFNRIRLRGSKTSERELQGGHFFHLPTSYGCASEGAFSRAKPSLLR